MLHQFDYVEGVNKFGSKVSRYLLKQKRTFVTRASVLQLVRGSGRVVYNFYLQEEFESGIGNYQL